MSPEPKDAAADLVLKPLIVSVDVSETVYYPIDSELVMRATEEAFRVGTTHGMAPLLPDPRAARHWTVSVLITSDEEMQRLNRDFRGVDSPTDVLSFSMLEGEVIAVPVTSEAPLGEIAISYPYVLRQAADLGHPAQKELAWLVVHGMLQLIGFTHETDERAELMEGLEQKALKAMGLT